MTWNTRRKWGSVNRGKQSGVKLKMLLIHGIKHLYYDRNFKRLGCLLMPFARMKFLKSSSKAHDRTLDVLLNRCSILKITATLFYPLTPLWRFHWFKQLPLQNGAPVYCLFVSFVQQSYLSIITLIIQTIEDVIKKISPDSQHLGTNGRRNTKKWNPTRKTKG